MVLDATLAALGLAALAAWLHDRHLATRARRQACLHAEARFISLDDRGVWWSKHCDACGAQWPYRVTRPARSYPDNPTCWKRPAEECSCGMSCKEDRSRNPGGSPS